MPDTEGAKFTYRGARSGSLLLGVALVIVVETVAMHAWLRPHHATVAWSLTILSLGTLVWLGLDFHRMGRGAIAVQGQTLHLDVGMRVRARIEVAAIADIVRPTWRDLPVAGTADAAEYRNVTKPSEPNVLLVMREPVSLRVASRLSIVARRIGVYVDDPDRFILAIRLAQAATPAAAR